MNESEAKKKLIGLWLEKAEDAMASAELELKEGHTNFAVNRLYYACFYAVTALLLGEGKQFTRHSAVKSEFVRSYIKTSQLDAKWNSFIRNYSMIDRRGIIFLQLLLRNRTFQLASKKLVNS